MANNQARMGDSVDKTMAEVASFYDQTPTSLAEQAAGGGWDKKSPQGSTTPYDRGKTDDDATELSSHLTT